jgi:ribosome-associated protein
MTDNQPVPATQAAPATLPEPLVQAVDAARQKLAKDLIVLDLRPSDAFTDYFVICSGRTSRQVTAIANAVTARLKVVGCRPSHVEGYGGADWILIDCFDFIVHIFTPETLDFYALERLWGEADRVDLADQRPPDQRHGDRA